MIVRSHSSQRDTQEGDMQMLKKMLCNEELVHILSHLIEVCQQSQVSYLDAVKSMPTLVHRAACAQYALQRENFTAHLRQQILCLSGKPNTGYGPAAKQRCQQTFGIRSFVKTSSSAAVLHECKLSEETAKAVYEEILAMHHLLPQTIYEIICHQYEKILMAHQEIQGWYQANTHS